MSHLKQKSYEPKSVYYANSLKLKNNQLFKPDTHSKNNFSSISTVKLSDSQKSHHQNENFKEKDINDEDEYMFRGSVADEDQTYELEQNTKDCDDQINELSRDMLGNPSNLNSEVDCRSSLVFSNQKQYCNIKSETGEPDNLVFTAQDTRLNRIYASLFKPELEEMSPAKTSLQLLEAPKHNMSPIVKPTENVDELSDSINDDIGQENQEMFYTDFNHNFPVSYKASLKEQKKREFIQAWQDNSNEKLIKHNSNNSSRNVMSESHQSNSLGRYLNSAEKPPHLRVQNPQQNVLRYLQKPPIQTTENSTIQYLKPVKQKKNQFLNRMQYDISIRQQKLSSTVKNVKMSSPPITPKKQKQLFDKLYREASEKRSQREKAIQKSIDRKKYEIESTKVRRKSITTDKSRQGTATPTTQDKSYSDARRLKNLFNMDYETLVNEIQKCIKSVKSNNNSNMKRKQEKFILEDEKLKVKQKLKQMGKEYYINDQIIIIRK